MVGLWCALIAARRGATVTLIEKRKCGAGASGGVLGALMPHQPVGWNAKKQFQLDGLLSLPGRIADLERATGVDCGYRRVGRLMPIAHAEKRRQSAQWAYGARRNWPEGLDWTVLEGNPAPGWLADTVPVHGCNRDTLAARLYPRGLVGALGAAVSAMPKIRIKEQAEAIDVADEIGLFDGAVLAPGATILAAGTGSFPLVDPADPHRIGRGVKGQGALLAPAAPVDPGLPILFDRGVYVIAHDSGHVAVGSTSEDSYAAPETTDSQLDALIDKASALCPALDGARIAERWAGVRPRAAGREPLVGPLPGRARLVLATGGFKITFAIAHLMAEAAVALAAGEPPPQALPAAFLPESRLRETSLTPPRSA